MERNLDRVRLQVENRGDLPGAEIGAEAKCKELPISLIELRDGIAELETLKRRFLMALTRTLRHLRRRCRGVKRGIGDATPRDPNQP